MKLYKNNIKMYESESYNFEKIRIFDEKVRELLNKYNKLQEREISFSENYKM